MPQRKTRSSTSERIDWGEVSADWLTQPSGLHASSREPQSLEQKLCSLKRTRQPLTSTTLRTNVASTLPPGDATDCREEPPLKKGQRARLSDKIREMRV